MAYRAKTDSLPPQIPKALQSIIQAFGIKSKKVVKRSILESINHIYGGVVEKISSEETASLTAIIMSIQPKDEMRAIHAAQNVVCYMIGMRKLSEHADKDQKLAIQFMRFGNSTIERFYAS